MNPATEPRRYESALFWFRRDLRSYDNAALYHALKNSARVHCVFVFDRGILDELSDREDRRVEFILLSLGELAKSLEGMGGGLMVMHGQSREVVPDLARRLAVTAVFTNHDYEPSALERDADVSERLRAQGCEFLTFKDHVIFERDEVLTRAGRPFTVFTPYKKAWLEKLTPFHCKAYPVEKYQLSLAALPGWTLPSLEAMGFRPTNLTRMQLPTGMAGARKLFLEFLDRIDRYDERRNFPGIRGVSYLSVHLRFGTISVREVVRAARSRRSAGAKTWLSELVWRDFYISILHHFPHVASRAFRPEFDALQFSNSKARFDAWCEGRTGYPLVDAAMRQLNQTGYMHNRLRMVAASFLVKDLHVDWRWGEEYFARKLNDFDLAANNGGWQWSASTGCDAQPWFRIFNPVTQSRNFDADGRFIRLYVPELAAAGDEYIHEPWTMPVAEQRAAGIEIGVSYPAPVVDHAQSRRTALEIYAKVRHP